MAGNQSQQSFLKRQRERQKQMKQLEKVAQRRERSAKKKLMKDDPNAAAHDDTAPEDELTGGPLRNGD